MTSNTDVCVLLANGFEEIEAMTLIDVLRRGGINVTTLGVEGHRVEGAHGVEIVADAVLTAQLQEKTWGMVVLPGGQPGADTLRDHPGVQSLLKHQNAQKAPIAAICAAPIALGAAGVLQHRQATCYPSFEPQLTGATFSSDQVVQDGHVFTSRGPGTAMAFALHLVSHLRGADVANQLRQDMLVTDYI